MIGGLRQGLAVLDDLEAAYHRDLARLILRRAVDRGQKRHRFALLEDVAVAGHETRRTEGELEEGVVLHGRGGFLDVGENHHRGDGEVGRVLLGFHRDVHDRALAGLGVDGRDLHGVRAGTHGHAESGDELVVLDFRGHLAILRLEQAPFLVGRVDGHHHLDHLLAPRVGLGETGGIALNEPGHENRSAVLGPDLHHLTRLEREVGAGVLEQGLGGGGLGQQIGQLHQRTLGVVLVGEVRLDDLQLGDPVELIAQTIALGQHAASVDRDLENAAGEGEAGAVLEGPGFGSAERHVAGAFLLHAVGSPHENVETAAVGERPNAPAHPVLGIHFSHELQVFRLELILRSIEVRIATGPEDLLELGRVGIALEILVRLLFFGKDDRADGIHPLFRVLVEIGKSRGGEDDDQGGRQTKTFHEPVPLNQ